MTKPRNIWRILTTLLVGSAVATRATGVPTPPEAQTPPGSDWDIVRQELELSTIAANLPLTVRRFLPSEGAAGDLSDAVRLSYAAADAGSFADLDAYWRAYPSLTEDAANALRDMQRRSGAAAILPAVPVPDQTPGVRLAQSKPPGGGYT